MNSIGERIKEFRQEIRMTQKELGKKTGLSTQVLTLKDVLLNPALKICLTLLKH